MLTVEEESGAYDYFESKTNYHNVSYNDRDKVPVPTAAEVVRVVYRVDSLILEQIRFGSDDRNNRINVFFNEDEWSNRKHDIYANV